MGQGTVPQHKRMAMGDKNVGFAKGGRVSPGMPSVKPPKLAGSTTGLPESPLTVAKRNNGVPGMKKGGSTKGC